VAPRWWTLADHFKSISHREQRRRLIPSHAVMLEIRIVEI
jgi:hypothetical protein